LLERTNLGASYIIKAPTHEIERARGRLLIHFMHELHRQPTAPVIRTVLSLIDRPDSSLRLETFSNLDDPDQRANLEALRAQNEVFLLFYDEGLAHRLTKRVPRRYPQLLTRLLTQATVHRATIPDAVFDFDRAKAEVINATSL